MRSPLFTSDPTRPGIALYAGLDFDNRRQRAAVDAAAAAVDRATGFAPGVVPCVDPDRIVIALAFTRSAKAIARAVEWGRMHLAVEERQAGRGLPFRLLREAILAGSPGESVLAERLAEIASAVTSPPERATLEALAPHSACLVPILGIIVDDRRAVFSARDAATCVVSVMPASPPSTAAS